MKSIKIDFIDFWPNLDKENNYFYNLLSTKYEVTISDTPDLIIYSCFGQDYLKYTCKRIFYTGENLKADYTACDFAFTFDYTTHKRHFRLPIYSLYIEDFNMLNKLKESKSKKDLKDIWKNKTKFCCMVVSNPHSKKRLEFFQELSKFRRIDSGGLVFNNVGGRVNDKLEFIKQYKFVLSFENYQENGYTTEKILEPIFIDSIPIYWGNKKIGDEFNAKRFINYSDFKSVGDLYEKLVEIENNFNLALDIIDKRPFSYKRLDYEE